VDQATVLSAVELVYAAPVTSPPILTAPQPANLLLELEAQQDHLLRELDDLNMCIEQAIVAGQMSVRRPGEADAK
jgi:hypothetical protein